MSTDNRFAFLKLVHEESNGDETNQVNAAVIAAGLGIDEQELRTVTQYLSGEGLLIVNTVVRRIPAFVTITHAGVKAVESGIL